jgi:hypothetical protein
MLKFKGELSLLKDWHAVKMEFSHFANVLLFIILPDMSFPTKMTLGIINTKLAAIAKVAQARFYFYIFCKLSSQMG